MTTVSHPCTIRGCLISEAPNVKLPSHSGHLPIVWDIKTHIDGVIDTLRYPLILTSHAEQYEQLRRQIHRPTTEPSKAIVFLDAQKTDSIGPLINKAVLANFPTASFGDIPVKTSALADHIFFGSESMHFFDRFLLSHRASISEIRSRFRRWSQHLHPDRFVQRAKDASHLATRMDKVYTIIGDTYRLLSDPVSCMIHRYWLQRNDVARAISLHRSNPLIKALSILPDDESKERLVKALMLQEQGQWTKVYDLLGHVIQEHPTNTGLKRWQDSIKDILAIIGK